MVASCGGTTPSAIEYRQEIGTGSVFGRRRYFARDWVRCAAVPIGCEIRRYSAFTSAGDLLPPGSKLTGLPSVMTERTHSVASCAPYMANMPPRLQPRRLTVRPLL